MMPSFATSPTISVRIRGNAVVESLHRQKMTEAKPILDQARDAVAFMKPSVLPPQDQEPNQRLPETYQSTGARGLTTMVGRFGLALYPPNDPWMDLRPAPSVLMDPRAEPVAIEQIRHLLFLRKLAIQATLESANLVQRRYRRRSGFRSRKLQALTQLCATGDVLEMLQDDYRMKVFRREQYTTTRDSAGDVLLHTVHERIDPLTLDDFEIQLAGMSRGELMSKRAHQRMVDMYTIVEWQPRSEVWVIQQEINGHVIRTTIEPISPYFSTAFELVVGEHYGRGIGEMNLGDLRSHDKLSEAEVDFAGMASRWLWAIDNQSRVTEDDLLQPTGRFFKARVAAGAVQDVAPLRMEKLADFSVVRQKNADLGNQLDKNLGRESGTQPTGDRVTRFQAERFALENDTQLGGIYGQIADDQQVPLVQRAHWQMQRDGLLPVVPDELIEIVAVTGLEALADDIKLQRVLSVTQIIAQMGEEAMRKIDPRVFADIVARYGRVHEPGLIKPNHVLEDEDRQRMVQLAAQQAIEQSITSAGAITEQRDAAAIERGAITP